MSKHMVVTAVKLTVLDATTRLALPREATDEERSVYEIFNADRNHAFHESVRVGDVVVEEDCGFGIWFGGAGF